MKTLHLAALTSCALCAATGAWAQEVIPLPVPVPVPILVPPPPVAPIYAPAPPLYRLRSGIGMEALFGGGVTQFFDNNATNAVGPGAAWSARFDIGTRTHLGGEVAYVGSAQPIYSGSNSRSSSALFSNGVETLVRWNILTGWLQPYAGVGLGYKRFSVVSSTSENTSDIRDVDNVVHLPAAVGVAFRNYGFVFDTRFAVSAPLQSSLIRGSPLASWDLTAKVGYEF